MSAVKKGLLGKACAITGLCRFYGGHSCRIMYFLTPKL